MEKTTVEEYCVSEGWIKVAVGKARDRHGRPTLLTLKGKVEAYFLDAPGDQGFPMATGDDVGFEVR